MNERDDFDDVEQLTYDGSYPGSEYDRGMDHGWTAANYHKAYGGDPFESDNFRKGSFFYREGYEVGVCRYSCDQWSDGTDRF